MFYECKRQFPAAHEEQYVISKRVHQNVLQIDTHTFVRTS